MVWGQSWLKLVKARVFSPCSILHLNLEQSSLNFHEHDESQICSCLGSHSFFPNLHPRFKLLFCILNSYTQLATRHQSHRQVLMASNPANAKLNTPSSFQKCMLLQMENGSLSSQLSPLNLPPTFKCGFAILQKQYPSSKWLVKPCGTGPTPPPSLILASLLTPRPLHHNFNKPTPIPAVLPEELYTCVLFLENAFLSRLHAKLTLTHPSHCSLSVSFPR